MHILTFCTPPYKPIHPANSTRRYEFVNIVAKGKRRELNIAKRENVRNPIDSNTSGRDIFDTIPSIPKRATMFAKSFGSNKI